MTTLDPDHGHVTAVDWLTLDEQDRDGQHKLLGLARRSVDEADHPGWVSSALHAGRTRAGVAGFTQWRTAVDLRAHHDDPARQDEVLRLGGLTTGNRLLVAELVSVQHAPAVVGGVDITPTRDDWTSVAIQRVAPEDQDALVAELTRPRDEWVHLLPGYRSHSVLRGLDGTFVINYAQWESEEAYWAFHGVPEHEWPPHVRESRDRARRLTRSWEYNTFRVVHSRTAD
ncbi:antibiotic biosynthesis monooxygenase [Streptomyces scabiei]|uniref:antibiotic biosynthesis monooxygenase family protein n=1 Tax=Streptomyces scabiei TaxID=1930 RepID=UPI0029907ABF|nr:antibiotic biosynthesis monooxygenase [Streptomyces scabiei]MDW8809005.1 antibiotic biosynthesis monooxygenase [Streptomyces scabiei]